MTQKNMRLRQAVAAQGHADDALRESEEKYRILVENTRAIIYTLTSEGIFTFVSKAWTAFQGSAADQVIGKSIENFIHPDDLEYCRTSLENVIRTGQARTSIEYRIKHVDGTWRWHRSHGFPVKDETGRVVGYQGIASDITDEKRVKDALQESLNRWQTTFDAIPDIVCVISVEHEFLEINLAGARALQLPREEILGKKCYKLVHGTDASLPICPCSSALESGVEESSEYTQGGRIYSLIAWPQKDEAGRVISFVHIVKDITDRKNAENALRESEQNFRTLAGSGRALIWTAGTDTLCNYFNKVWLEFTGRSLEQELGNGWVEGVHPEDLQGCVNTYLAAFASRKSFSMEYRLRNRNGEYRWILDDGSPRYGADGAFVGYIGHCLDITDRKKAEDEIHLLNENLELRVQHRTAELIAANKELEAFSYSVSHDLRAPLRGIEGFQRIFLDEYGTQIPPKGIGYLERAQHSARYMQKLIDDMLELSRLSLNEMHIQRTDLSALASDVVADLRTVDPHRDVSISIQPGMSVMGDPGFLRIILTNLLGNAWKFSSGRERAQIEVGSQNDLERGLSFFVRDDGIGFDETYKGKLFNAFQRLHSVREFPGTGIGLATVARAVKRHGGEVWAEGKVDQGATFYFTIP